MGTATTTKAAATDDRTRARYAGPDCGPAHRRWFEPSRLREVREDRGLTRREAAERIIAAGDGGDLDESLEPHRFDAAVLDVIEAGKVVPSAPFIFAAAHAYGVEPSAFSECHECLGRLIGGAK